jgi:hypothetical protein
MSCEIQASSLRGAISQFLTPAKISEIATAIGFDSGANFTPGEYASLLDKTTKIVLGKLREDLHSLNPEPAPLKIVTHIVDEMLSKECKRVPQDDSFPDIPFCLQNLLTSILSKLRL